jgi:hypothetical protein
MRDDQERGDIKLIHQSTKDLEADAMTKHLSAEILNIHMSKVGVGPVVDSQL